MEHAFVDLVRRSPREGLCTRWGCTTCGARDFKQAVRALPGGAAGALARVDLDPLQAAAGWRDCTLNALWDLNVRDRSAVLEAWLPHSRTRIRFADFILFYVVRGMTVDPAVSDEWVSECEAAAVVTGDVSMAESLVYTLQQRLSEHPATLALAERLAMTHPAVERALSFTGLCSYPTNP